jgi:hypothetical protein
MNQQSPAWLVPTDEEREGHVAEAPADWWLGYPRMKYREHVLKHCLKGACLAGIELREVPMTMHD